jgi:hypothetical protein
MDQALLDFVQRFSFFPGLENGAGEMRGRAFGNHQLADFVHQRGQGDGGPHLRFLHGSLHSSRQP